ncbi:MAG: hypothetical protein H7325_05065 [Pedobacter sp.]|nr:hypothetical protein [Pedobacter sp.]
MTIYKAGSPYNNPLMLLEYQIEKYTELLPLSRSHEERSFRRRELYNLKQSLLKFYN